MIEDYYQQMQDVLSNTVFQEYGVLGLFLNSLLSATAIPLPTEILTSALLVGGENQFIIAIVLIAGSSIGGFINYFVGFGGNKLFVKFKNKKNQKDLKDQNKSHKILDKFGWSAIFFSSWIPVIGDLILISAGVKRFEFKKFVLFMIVGKIIKSVIIVTGLGALF